MGAVGVRIPLLGPARLAAIRHLGLPLDEHEQRIGRAALADDRRPGRYLDLGRQAGQPLEHRPRGSREDPEPLEHADPWRDQVRAPADLAIEATNAGYPEQPQDDGRDRDD